MRSIIRSMLWVTGALTATAVCPILFLAIPVLWYYGYGGWALIDSLTVLPLFLFATYLGLKYSPPIKSCCDDTKQYYHRYEHRERLPTLIINEMIPKNHSYVCRKCGAYH